MNQTAKELLLILQNMITECECHCIEAGYESNEEVKLNFWKIAGASELIGKFLETREPKNHVEGGE